MHPLAALVLRDVQLGDSPGWWPLPAGWLALVLVLVGAVLLCVWLMARRWHQRRAWARQFDQAMAQADSPVAQVLMAAELLRRGALSQAPQAATLQGVAWLAWLDADGRSFSDGPGRLLLDGGYRPSLPPDQAQAACALARRRFITLMTTRR